MEGLAGEADFEHAHRQLGELLGFIAGKEESDGSPDPWWLGKTVGFVFEGAILCAELRPFSDHRVHLKAPWQRLDAVVERLPPYVRWRTTNLASYGARVASMTDLALRVL